MACPIVRRNVEASSKEWQGKLSLRQSECARAFVHLTGQRRASCRPVSLSTEEYRWIELDKTLEAEVVLGNLVTAVQMLENRSEFISLIHEVRVNLAYALLKHKEISFVLTQVG